MILVIFGSNSFLIYVSDVTPFFPCANDLNNKFVLYDPLRSCK